MKLLLISRGCMHQALVCTLGKSNPGLPLVVLTSPGDLQQSSTDYIQSVASLHLVGSIDVSKRHYKEDGRYDPAVHMVLLLNLKAACMTSSCISSFSVKLDGVPRSGMLSTGSSWLPGTSQSGKHFSG